MNELQVKTVKLTPAEDWQLKAIAARTKQSVSEVLRAGLRDQANRYGIHPPTVIEPTIKKPRRRHDNSEY